MKLAAIVILYYPTRDLLDNISSYYNEVDQFYIFDNTESQSCSSLFEGLNKVAFFYDGQNRGIAQRINEGCKKAVADGFSWVLTMDQDSRFPRNTFVTYRHCVYQQPHWQTVAVFGMKYESYEMQSNKECSAKHTPFIITAGMLVNLLVATKLGGFDEQLFIDAVDHEYCLRANKNGYKTIRFNNIFLHHIVGAVVKRASLKTLYLVKKAKSVHAPIRCYYMLRNALYLAAKYEQDFPQIIAHNNLVVKMHLNRSFWYGRSALKTFLYVQKAKRHFKKGRMGKL